MFSGQRADDKETDIRGLKDDNLCDVTFGEMVVSRGTWEVDQISTDPAERGWRSWKESTCWFSHLIFDAVLRKR